MRKRKISSAGLAAILATALVTGGIFAWFISQDAAAEVVVTTGHEGGIENIKIDPVVPVNPGDVEPGKEVPLGPEEDPTKPPSVIENTGTKPLVLKLDLSSKNITALLDTQFDPNSNPAPADWKAAYDSKYVLSDVEIGGNTEQRYKFDEERTAAVASILLEETAEWAKVDDCYYTVIQPQGKVELKGLSIYIKNELGGYAKDANGVRSDSRQFEQKTQFIIKLEATTITAKAGSVEDQFGDGVLAALEAKGFTVAP